MSYIAIECCILRGGPCQFWKSMIFFICLQVCINACPYICMPICALCICACHRVAGKSRLSIYGHTYIHACLLLHLNAVLWWVDHVTVENPWSSVFSQTCIYVCPYVLYLFLLATGWLGKVDWAYMGIHIYIHVVHCNIMLYYDGLTLWIMKIIDVQNSQGQPNIMLYYDGLTLWILNINDFHNCLLICIHVYPYMLYLFLLATGGGAGKSRLSTYGHTHIHTFFLLQ